VIGMSLSRTLNVKLPEGGVFPCVKVFTVLPLKFFSLHELAAICYRVAKEYDRAIETFDRAADAYYKNHAYPFFESS